jgi:Rod binding domain-containing protein
MIVSAPHGPTAAQLATPQGQKTWKAAQDFEAMTLSALLQPMFETVQFGGDKKGGGMFGGGSGEEMWKPQFVQSVAKQMSAHGGLGLAVPVFNKMLQMQEARQEQSP